MSEIADYRQYYEELSKARGLLKSQREEEIKDKKITPPLSLIYIRGFKDKLYRQIAGRASEFKAIPILLDIGCGQGEGLGYIRRYFKGGICGIDISINQLLMARESLKSDNYCRFAQSYAESVPFKDGSFDCVIFSEVIEHLPQPDISLQEIYRVLKHRGYLFITTPNKYSYFHAIGRLIPLRFRRWLSKRLKGIRWDIDSSEFAPANDMEEHISLFSLSSLRRLLKREGFLIEDIEGGMLEAPVPYLFDRYPLLIRCWSLLDNLVSVMPFCVYLKSHFIVVARKP